MNGYPDAPGHRYVDAPVKAAVANAPGPRRLQRLGATMIREAGTGSLTADELADRLTMAWWSIQPRTTELRCKGVIRDSEKRRCKVIGKRAIVWVAERPE